MSHRQFDQLIRIAGTLKDVELSRLARLRAEQEALAARQQALRDAAQAVLRQPVADAGDVRMAERYRMWARGKASGMDGDLQTLGAQVEAAHKASARRFGQHEVLTKLRKTALLQERIDKVRRDR